MPARFIASGDNVTVTSESGRSGVLEELLPVALDGAAVV
jgi:hypothetical protein